MPGHRIFIILENPKERMEYVRFFEDLGFLVDFTPDGSDVLRYLIEKKTDVVIADVATPGFSAIEFLKKVDEAHILCQTILLAADPVVEHAVNLMKLGALDYLIKPLEIEQLDLCVKRALSVSRQILSSQQVSPSRKKKVKIIARDKGIQTLLALASRVANSSASVLIQGESGTGKELFAKYIHEKSDRCNRAFIAVNCAALPENLLESELFGHEKGSFTGAISRKIGKFELAHKGTLFLDEITEMQFHLQAKLLRVLQEKVVDRVGGIEPVDVDVRVIATTNRDAKQAIEKGDFREDLFYRLNTIPLVIPPLRDRKGDLEILCEFFIQKYCKIDGRHVKGMTKQAESLLNRHPFAGNVRELENIIHRAVLLADSDLIEPKDLMIDSFESKGDLPDSVGDQGLGLEPSSLRDMEQKMIFQTLDQTEGNRTHAAKILGISVRTLRNKLHEYKESN
ncbi:MAG: sigma-54 dependent transcriptional regulator [Proteobacteria bacterium]|nr:sigma-54 dependent transcriptional regulator [Pseudomonadota bacterium]MBU1584662.1 sigma-54 dependent transcriptional regulator [Pseudomonadota bacterium]MBU2451951.1 sigma-54 dependent transcriptional regulator [Pseudomonadota bacterium]MBU2631530.1 sigma-54 dependent transcriptional regulator [Pseudomonadota bacterium]